MGSEPALGSARGLGTAPVPLLSLARRHQGMDWEMEME